MSKVSITLDPITKRFSQVELEEKVCYICSGKDHVDDHHYDLCHGKISDETVPLCRRCHSTIHMYRGIHMFEDNLLDKAIEVWNKTQLLLKRPTITRGQIVRSKYWLKKHGIKHVGLTIAGTIPAFRTVLPHGEPLCGWAWISEHLNDLKDYVPRIEVAGPGISFTKDIKSKKELREVGLILKGLKKRRNGRKVIILDPITKRFGYGAK